MLSEWRRLELPTGDARIVVAVSGGADSTALLLACDELMKARRLTLALTVAHLDHGLRGATSAADAAWVAQLARELEHDVVVEQAHVDESAQAMGDNLEQAARRVRYAFLARVAHETRARAVLVAHTLDDQAETLLLALMRGSGAAGLGGMRAVRALDERNADVLLARPLLRWARRAETVAYCRARGIEVRADTLNEDERFARVRVRRRLVPLMETFNPRAVAALARTAELLRADSEALDEQAAQLLSAAHGRQAQLTMIDAGTITEAATTTAEAVTNETATTCAPPLRVDVLRASALAVRRRALRLWLKAGRGNLRRVTSTHVRAVERLLVGERGRRVAELPGGAAVERRRGLLIFHSKMVEKGAGDV
ncbi:MAG TPA: tRNA lysidine(34) synthetase TilS [Pyrinomonadaceae bacterium]|nr:tRNA lysidine(34) synthetase TilS [Pyrinomonadaceae bacterium]